MEELNSWMIWARFAPQSGQQLRYFQHTRLVTDLFSASSMAMLCHHCPGLKFQSEFVHIFTISGTTRLLIMLSDTVSSSSELDEHCLGHAKTQQLLHRARRSYGVRIDVAHTSSSLAAITRPNLADSVLPVYQSDSAEVCEPCDTLAEFMDKDPAYMISRRFSRLNTLNLLWMQDELADLEEQYRQLRARRSLANNELVADTTPALKKQIRNKLREYGALS